MGTVVFTSPRTLRVLGLQKLRKCTTVCNYQKQFLRLHEAWLTVKNGFKKLSNSLKTESHWISQPHEKIKNSFFKKLLEEQFQGVCYSDMRPVHLKTTRKIEKSLDLVNFANSDDQHSKNKIKTTTKQFLNSRLRAAAGAASKACRLV